MDEVLVCAGSKGPFPARVSQHREDQDRGGQPGDASNLAVAVPSRSARGRAALIMDVLFRATCCELRRQARDRRWIDSAALEKRMNTATNPIQERVKDSSHAFVVQANQVSARNPRRAAVPAASPRTSLPSCGRRPPPPRAWRRMRVPQGGRRDDGDEIEDHGGMPRHTGDRLPIVQGQVVAMGAQTLGQGPPALKSVPKLPRSCGDVPRAADVRTCMSVSVRPCR
jgi:hypothetical protein